MEENNMKIFDSLFAKKTDKAPISEKLSAMREQTEQKSSELLKKKPWECLPQDFAVTDTETARQFFFACNGSRTIMEKHFPKEVTEAFDALTESSMRRAFTLEYALGKFDALLDGSEEDIPSVAHDVIATAGYWGMDYYDPVFIEKLMAVAALSNKRSPNTADRFGREYPVQVRHDTWIKDYLRRYNNGGEYILKVKPLVEQTSDYMNAKYSPPYEHFIGEVISLCNTLKGLLLETQLPDSSLSMEFALADDEIIDKILGEFSAQCKGSSGHIKGMIHRLNCTYGIRTPEFFLTAASDAVDRGSNNSWDTFRFAAVFFAEDVTAVFECRRDKNGYFVPEKKYETQYPILSGYSKKIARAVALYRNRSAKEDFQNSHAECCLHSANYDRQKELCRRFGDCFGFMRERINGQSISETLTELIDCCEEVSPMIGIEQTTFNEPATEAEITECEEKNGIKIPLPMREFLMFSNGASLFEYSTTVYGTSEIGGITLDGYDDENAEIYIPIGDFIGDGTMFVLNKTSGEVGEYDHETGEVTLYGDFEVFLAEVMDFHCSDYMD